LVANEFKNLPLNQGSDFVQVEMSALTIAKSAFDLVADGDQ